MINILFLILTFPWLVSSDDLPECVSMEENTATKRRQKVSLDISISAKHFHVNKNIFMNPLLAHPDSRESWTPDTDTDTDTA